LRASGKEACAVQKLSVLVVGAMGRQGSAIARALLHAGHNVHALTADLAHPVATALRLRGARLAWANPDNESEMKDAMNDRDVVVAIPSASADEPDIEARRGLIVANLAAAANTSHFIYLSAMHAWRLTGVSHLDARHEVEQYIRASGLPATIVCPGFYMENLLTGRWLDHLQRGELSMPISPSRKLQQVTRLDVARFIRRVVERREAFIGRRLCLASDELTPIEMAATLARAAGRAVHYVKPDPAVLRVYHPAVADIFDVIDREPGCADVTALRADYPEVNWHTLHGWATRQEWALLRS
jgi:uncharacterized protein YbjT (DUF2867 family)